MFNEIFESYEIEEESLYDPESDESVYKITDTRKPKLTLRILNKLRMHRAFKEREDLKRADVVSTVYGHPPLPPE